MTLIWPDEAIKKQWLQVTVKATAATGLSSPDVFYFGNAIGESGNSATSAQVSAVDEIAAQITARNPQSSCGNFSHGLQPGRTGIGARSDHRGQ